MNQRYAFLILFLVGFQWSTELLGQHQYCSRYRQPTPDNQLAIDDFRSDSVDIIHTHIELSIPDVSVRYLEGKADLHLRAKTAEVTELRLDFEGLDVDSVTGLSGLTFSQEEQHLIVGLPAALDTENETVVTVHYKGAPITDGTGWGGFYFQGGFAWNLGVGFESDPHSYGRVWFPCFDNFIERSTYSFVIHTQSDKFASCNGTLIDSTLNQNGVNTFEWSLSDPIPSYLVCIAVGSYVVMESDFVSTATGVITPIQLFARASDTANLSASFIHLQDAIEGFEEFYGEYRFEKVGYSLVPFNAGAMEHATNITYPIYAANGGLGQESLMAHELAHMWWGDNVTCETDGDMWINEGWASFSAYLFQELVYGRDAYEAAVLDDLSHMLKLGHILEGGYRPVSGQPHDLVYGDHVYRKGALVAHNLRGYMGDGKFINGIHAFMDHFEFQPVNSDSLERFLSNHSGIDLTNFFRDWVYQGGYNVVVLDSFRSEANGMLYNIDLHVQQKLKGRSAFHDDTRIYYTVFDKEGNTATGGFKMSGQYATVEITADVEPHFIVLNESNEMSWARTGNQAWVNNNSAVSFGLSNWNVQIDDVDEEALLRVDQVWSYPDPLKDWSNKAYRLNMERYWVVSGIDIDQVNMTATFFYDGRDNSSAGKPDGDLFSYNDEDSLILLHRAHPSLDWEPYPYYEQNILGNPSDAFGTIELEQVLEGEYVLAVKDASVLGAQELVDNQKFRLFPNPSSGKITVQQYEYRASTLEIYNLNGARLNTFQLQQKTEQIQMDTLASGVYFYRLRDAEGAVLQEEKIILTK